MALEYRNLGRTGVKVSSLCLGAMMFGGRTTHEDSIAIIDRALGEGINFIDTANVYNQGRSEEAVGDALQRSGRRNDIVLATKAYNPTGKGVNDWGLSRRHLIAACEDSLRRLKTDHIDLYQLHRPQPGIPVDETLRALDDLVRSGKVRYLGTSTWAAWQVMESLWASKELGLNRFVCEQPPYNLLDRRIERELIPMARTYGVGIIPWSPLAGGMLTGKYDRNAEPAEDTRFRLMVSDPGAIMARYYKRRWADRAFDAIEAFVAFAEERGQVPSQLALAWCMNQPGVTSAIIGPRTMEQYADNMKAVEIRLTADDLRALDAIVPPGDAVSRFYEAEFGPGEHRW